MHGFDNGDGKIDEAEMIAGHKSLMAPVDRERLCNDLMNTSVMAALIGGFALGSLEAPGEGGATFIDNTIYLLAYITVHACTCSALTSAFVYAAVNKMEDDVVTNWAKKQKFLLQLPMIKFVMGCMAYMVSVILTSWRDFDHEEVWRFVALIIGLMSVASVWMAFAKIEISILKGSPGQVTNSSDSATENFGDDKATKVTAVATFDREK